MKQSWDEYVEGRLAIGGCGLTLLIIGFVIAVIIIALNNFFNNFSVGKLIILIIFVLMIIGVIVNTIIDYKGSKEKTKTCNERKVHIKEKRAREEAKRLEAERITEEERIAQEKAKKKKQKTIMGIVVSVACIAIVFIIVLNTVIIPNGKYNDAVALMNEGKYDEAVSIFVELENYKDSEQKARDSEQKASEARLFAAKKSFANIQVGGYVKFGMYEQDNNSENGKEFIDWLVLDLKDNKALVISKYILDQQTYHNSRSEVTWEKCYLRSWLNSTFYSTAFTVNEKDLILLSNVPAHKNPEYTDVNSGEDTKDKVFLLSIIEMSKYFEVESDRVSPSTEYAISQDNAPNPPGCVHDYWLRTPGRDNLFAVTVANENPYYVDPGSYDEMGEIVYLSYDNGESAVSGVRPAMWIDLSKIK